MWMPKYRTIWGPTYHDDVNRRFDSAVHVRRGNYKTHDPLFFDHDMERLNGGVQLIIDQLHDRANYTMPIKNIAHLIYNMQVKDIYDPILYEKFETHMEFADKRNITARHCYGALVAYFKSN